MQVLLRAIGLLSLTGGVTFLLFCCLRLGLKKAVSARWQGRGLLFLTLFWIVPTWKVGPQDYTPVYRANISRTMVKAESQQATATLDPTMFTVDPSWLAYGYCFVAIFCLLRFLLQYRRQYQHLLQNSWELTGELEQNLLQELLRQQQIKKSVRLRCNPLIKAPILVGLWKYQIILPNYSLQTEQLKLIFAHELAHVKFYDNWRKIYLELLKCVYWFHPCIYWLKNMADKLCELACDEQVVRGFDGAQRKQYGFLLLDMVQKGQAVQLGCSGLSQKGNWMKTRLLHIVNCQKNKKPVCCLFLCLLCVISAVGCGVSDTVEQKLPGVARTVKLEIMQDDEIVEQKPIETFSWEQCAGNDRIMLLINGEAYSISGNSETCYVFPAGLQQYWEALAQLPEEALPKNLNLYLNELVLQTEINAMEWEKPEKPILTFSWEKELGEDRTTLWINGEKYVYQVLDDGNLVINSAVMTLYGETIQNIPKEQMPEDLYTWLNNREHRTDSSANLTSSVELAPGERIECSGSVYFDNLKGATFHVSCQYGNVAKLKMYRGYMEGDRDISLGYFTATKGKWYGELNATIPKGSWYFTIENGGSHNIMVDSVTLNF